MTSTKSLSNTRNSKAKMLEEREQLKNKLTGNLYLVGSIHLIWEQITFEINKIWDYFKIIGEDICLAMRQIELYNKLFKNWELDLQWLQELSNFSIPNHRKH